jgi:hypothetical protein
MSISEICKKVTELQGKGKNGVEIAQVLRDKGVDAKSVMTALDRAGYVVCPGITLDPSVEVSERVIIDREKRALAGAERKLFEVRWPAPPE